MYDLYAPNDRKRLKPPGQFNSSRIVVQDDRVEHWLNGSLIVSARIGDDQWKERLACSKLDEYEDFGRNRFGRIMLTDHKSEVWYRNIQFEPLLMRPRLP